MGRLDGWLGRLCPQALQQVGQVAVRGQVGSGDVARHPGRLTVDELGRARPQLGLKGRPAPEEGPGECPQPEGAMLISHLL